jgi:hypothetical protein
MSIAINNNGVYTERNTSPLQRMRKTKCDFFFSLQEINYYFAPCVLKTSPPEDLLVCSDCKNRRSTSVLCFTTTSGFLPTAVFNKLLAACIDKWPISKLNKKNLVFCGCGVFDLEDNHKLYVYFFDHIINIWITKYSTTDEEPSTCLCQHVHEFVSDFLRNRMRITSGIEVLLRCNQSNIHNNDNLFELENMSAKQEVVCNTEPMHHVHRTNELIKYWLCKLLLNFEIFDKRYSDIVSYIINKSSKL